jgi:hypothetical protein
MRYHLKVVNAGVSEIGQFGRVTFQNGKPVKPNLTTLNVNLIGLAYSALLVATSNTSSKNDFSLSNSSGNALPPAES